MNQKYPRIQNKTEANAQLIAEAFNVANATGQSPQQLADANAKLREALQAMVKEFSVIADARNEIEQEQAMANAEAALEGSPLQAIG